MKLITQTPKVTLNKAFLKQRPLRSEIETFKGNLQTLLSKVQTKESEENKKNHVRDFLLDTYYKGIYEVNTKDRKDLVIHLDKTNESNVGVIVEAKSPDNKAEMLKPDKANTKALQELVLYYFDERQTKGNTELKNLVITNAYEWFIFDANVFDKKIYRNTQIKRLYETYKNDKKDNPFFYEELRKIFDNLAEEIICTYFDLREYEKIINNADLEDDKELIALYKILSPTHLLKLPFADDSNSLNKPFYDELLHIIGLEEVKEKSKSIIRRKVEGNRNQASLLENAMTILKTKDSLRRIKNIADYGATSEERYFNVALELCIVWINRILFLKLLESQLVNYHERKREYRFLDIKTIPDFDELFTLFHQVLAKTFADREENIREKYKRVPYLNSSLFEISELEDLTISIESLKDTAHLPFINSTILKRQKAENQTFGTLEYLFKFLDAYDFASEGAEDVQEDNRSLINASVLGKVFEKINGYKDGSIFTPGFITMYMCRQAIRLAVIQKFKDVYKLDIDTFDELMNFTKNTYKTEKIIEYNALINSLHLCDPAVGSGHFLVSSLNEIIAIKSELGLLADESGVRLSEYRVVIENDELIITDEKGDIFEYQINENGKPTDKAQRLQKTLFHEKQTLIENCLFGVDINPNSVKICRLRLWIELLKNAYYKEGANFAELETLPNIDINIKEGNSLLSRFTLDADLKEVLKNKKNIINDYRSAVAGYKNERNRDQKRKLLEIIDEIKSDFKTEIYKHHPKMVDLAKKERRLFEINSPQLFEKFSEGEREVLSRNLERQIGVLNQEINDIKTNAIYKNAFEWRFEFPEVLDDDGNFTGFDIVIGNPPYGFRNVLTATEKAFYRKEKKLSFSSGDVAELFIVVTQNLVKSNGVFTFIIPKKSLYGESWKSVREFWLNNDLRYLVDTSKAFENVLLEMNAFLLFKRKFNNSLINIGTVEFGESEIKFFGTFSFDEIFTDNLTNAQIYRGSYPKDFLQKIKDKSFSKKVIKAKIGISNITSHLTFENKGNYPCVKGFDIQKYGLKEPIRYLKGEIAKLYLEKYKHDKIIAQEIIAHIQNPFPHIEIIAFLDENGSLFNDTCAEIIPLRNDLNNKFLLAYLQSKFCNWYCYNIIYNRAIRTMHFIDYYVSQIPIPKIEEKDQQPFVALVDRILELKKDGKDTQALENEIDALVYRLYDLTADEIAIVEGRKG